MNEFNRPVVEKDKIMNKELLKKHFGFPGLIDMQRKLYKTKNRQKERLGKCN